MNINTEIETQTMPVFLEKTNLLMKYIQELSYDEAKSLWRCNDKIAKTSYEYFTNMSLIKGLTPAILSYEGIQYQYMAPSVFEEEQWDYVKKHLYILSGFYGILRPFDGIVPYRLEMQAAVEIPGYRDLYDFWGDSLYQKLYEDTQVVLNLASKEYSKCIEKHLTSKNKFITCTFGEYKDGKITTKGTYAKIARGEMVRFLADNKVEKVSQVTSFDRLGYHYDREASDEKNMVFIKE